MRGEDALTEDLRGRTKRGSLLISSSIVGKTERSFMTNRPTPKRDYSRPKAPLYLAFELSTSKWRLGFTTGLGQKPRLRTITAGDRHALRKEIAAAKSRFGLLKTAPVLSCYEAGREAFWLHRYLLSEGIENVIVDSASIEVKRRSRRAKSDSLDVEKLAEMLVRYDLGNRRVWAVVRVPTVEEEDARQLHRELQTAKSDRVRVTNRIRGFLANQGIRIPGALDLAEELPKLRLWNGSTIPEGLRERLKREWEQVTFLVSRIKKLEATRRAVHRTRTDPATEKVRALMSVRGVGPNIAEALVRELFGWRTFENRRQVGSFTGLTPTPFQSGNQEREQGISKAGNRRLRATLTEFAWLWIRLQPDSALSQWWTRRFGSGSSRLRRIGIVAVARRLAIAMWKFLEAGEIPDGAVLKA
jgi:transposase